MFLYGLSTVHSIYIGLFAIVVVAMFVVPVISTIPANYISYNPYIIEMRH